MTKAYLGLGSNMGDKQGFMIKALHLIEEHRDIKLIRTASFYRTKPVGFIEQDSFINTVAEIDTSLTPRELLQAVNQIEELLDRKRTVRWGPRTIDIDILLYGNEIVA
ncbi:MAG: 2-amino-4-hydroxy-6-hydroxymethyldihydropteridine diphosphokinase, partial [Bacillota bacterium]|nr:2-amino-4-hydroxy-6-hydroxymethyldihydropteridine diphosphokinase [Bacillota bacterium]